MSSLDPRALSWTALLGRWVEFAQASLALPRHGSGGCIRASIPDIIQLQAVTLALTELTELVPEERPLARDRAEVLVMRSTASLISIWSDETMPRELTEIIADARDAVVISPYAGARELRWRGPGILTMIDFSIDAWPGTLLLAAPGTLLMPSEPVAWWVGGADLVVRGCAVDDVPIPHQVYRELDDDGRIVGDVVAPITIDAPPGLPLLVPLFEDGRPIGSFTMDAAEWERTQRAMIGDALIPVETWLQDDASSRSA